MLPFVLTGLTTLYLLGPEVFSSFLLGLFLVRRASQSSTSEQFVRGTTLAIVPLLIAWFTRKWFCLKQPKGAGESARTFFSGLYSTSYFEAHRDAFFSATSVFWQTNVCFLIRIYLIVLIWSAILVFISMRLGWVREKLANHSLARRFLNIFLLPRISEWHLCLSSMLLKSRKDIDLGVDILTKSGILYRGSVDEKNVANDGTLQSIILKNPERFLKTDYDKVRSYYEGQTSKDESEKPRREDYWRKIPGELFIIAGSDVTSVNVRHVKRMQALKPAEDEKLLDAMKKINDLLQVVLKAEQKT